MGITLNSNIKLIGRSNLPKEEEQEVNSESTKALQREYIHKNKILIMDTIPAKHYYPVFINTNFPEDYIPSVIFEDRGGMGGAGPIDLLGLFLNPSSDLYLPKIIISGLAVDLTKEAVKKVISMIISKFRSQRTKRQQIVFVTQNTIEYYEIPSEANGKDIENALISIPTNSEKYQKSAYFIRSLKDNIWVEEDSK